MHGLVSRWFWVLDAAVVVSFVVIGREDHGFTSGVSDYVRVAAPFLLALGLSIITLRAWRSPLRLRTGLFVAIGTIAVGMLARRFVWDDGTAWTFVAVTSAFLVAGMVGWRLIVAGVVRIRTTDGTAAT